MQGGGGAASEPGAPQEAAPPPSPSPDLAPTDDALKLSRRERRAAEKVSRSRSPDEQRAAELERFRLRWEAGGGDPESRPPLFPRSVWGQGRAIVHSPAASKAGLRWLARAYGGQVAGRAAEAAFGGGRWDHSDPCARKMIALVVVLYQLGRPMPWGRSRDGRIMLGHCVRGFGRGAFCRLLADPHSTRPIAVETLSRYSDRWAGYIPRGFGSRVFQPVQVPAAAADRFEIGPTGYVMNRYWLLSPGSGQLQKPALMLDIDTAVEHVQGWDAAMGEPVRAPRGRQLGDSSNMLEPPS